VSRRDYFGLDSGVYVVVTEFTQSEAPACKLRVERLSRVTVQSKHGLGPRYIDRPSELALQALRPPAALQFRSLLRPTVELTAAAVPT